MLNFNDMAVSVRSNFEIILFKFFFRDAFHNDAVASSVAAAAATGHGHSEIFFAEKCWDARLSRFP